MDQVKDYLLQNGRTLDITYDKSGANAEFRPEHLSQTPVGLSIGNAMRAMKIKEAEEKVQHNEESSFAAAFRLLDNYFKEDTKL